MKEEKQYAVYIMTSQRNTVLYTGVTGRFPDRIYEHKNKIIKGFTSKYNIDKLVYCELYGDVENAIFREKQIKAGSRKKKVELIKSVNPKWKDLSLDL